MSDKLQIREENKNRPEVVVEIFNKLLSRKIQAEFLIARGGSPPRKLRRWRKDIEIAENGLEQLREQVPNINEMVETHRKELEQEGFYSGRERPTRLD